MDSNKCLKTGPKRGPTAETSLKYSVDSFDRFGDDLCELLLSYLTFREKFLLENVCKQWKRTIYNRQRVLRVIYTNQYQRRPDLMTNNVKELMIPIVSKIRGRIQNMKTLDIKRLESFLNKCKYIETIILDEVYLDTPLLHLITQLCPYLKSIKIDLYNVCEEAFINFGQICGPNLQEIRFNKSYVVTGTLNFSYKYFEELVQNLLNYCINIKSFQCENISIFDDKRVEFLPKLQSIDFKLKQNDSIKSFETFVDKYGNRLKKLKLSSDIEFQSFVDIMEQILRLKNIEKINILFSLKIEVNSINKENPNIIYEKLTQLSKDCPKLTQLKLNISVSLNNNIQTEFITDTLWQCLAQFVNLRQLDVICEASVNGESIKALKHLKHLTHLSIKCSTIGDHFFRNISLFVPNLKSLKLNTDYELTDSLMESLSKLKNLSDLSLGNPNHEFQFITDSGISNLLDNCPHLRRICFASRPNITAKTVDNLIEFANKNPKHLITFDSRNETLFSIIDLSTHYIHIPHNLRIIREPMRSVVWPYLVQNNHIFGHPLQQNVPLIVPPFPPLPFNYWFQQFN